MFWPIMTGRTVQWPLIRIIRTKAWSWKDRSLLWPLDQLWSKWCVVLEAKDDTVFVELSDSSAQREQMTLYQDKENPPKVWRRGAGSRGRRSFITRDVTKMASLELRREFIDPRTIRGDVKSRVFMWKPPNRGDAPILHLEKGGRVCPTAAM